MREERWGAVEWMENIYEKRCVIRQGERRERNDTGL